ncbi:MAG: DUF1553 domain-containing protein, partial [Verrucomicrobiota bacterium]
KGVLATSGPTPRQDDYHVSFRLPHGLSRITGWKLEVLPHASHTEGQYSRGDSGAFILTNVKLLVSREGRSQVRDLDLRHAVASGELNVKGRKYGKVKDTLDDDPRNGWTTALAEGHTTPKTQTAVFELTEPLSLEPVETVTVVLLQRSTLGHANIGRFRLSVTDQRGEAVRSLKKAPLEELAETSSESLPGELRSRLLAQFLLDDQAYQRIRSKADAAQQQLSQIQKAAKELNVQVLAERQESRETHVLLRGVWDAKGEVVPPGMPAAVLSIPQSAARNRLDLAQWLVSTDNPLTARVIVNHLWQMMFGAGLVRTPEDFGLQGELPTHPELLDWLAVELMESDWNLRHLLRLIATSNTYRQSSVTPESLRERDPDNRLLARAPRFRLPAWMIRDAALQSSGLLNPAVGGPPVRPWQPEGVWKEIFMGRFTYVPSVGPAQYRRTLYAFWRRASAPSFLFDSAQRRVCETGVRRTNTPLHALTLLNDVTMLEASRILAEEASDLDELSLHILSRTLTPEEAAIAERERKNALAWYQAHPQDATQLLTIGQQSPPTDRTRIPDIAAQMTVASMLLNLDESMTHE